MRPGIMADVRSGLYLRCLHHLHVTKAEFLMILDSIGPPDKSAS